MIKQKIVTSVAIFLLAFCMWTIGWVVNQVVTLPGWLHDFVVGIGLVTGFGFLYTAYKEITD